MFSTNTLLSKNKTKCFLLKPKKISIFPKKKRKKKKKRKLVYTKYEHKVRGQNITKGMVVF